MGKFDQVLIPKSIQSMAAISVMFVARNVKTEGKTQGTKLSVSWSLQPQVYSVTQTMRVTEWGSEL